MLWITYKAPGNRHEQEIVWEIGNDAPRVVGFDIIQVQARDDELTYIASNFHNIPIAVHRSCNTWTGPFADFIVRNL